MSTASLQTWLLKEVAVCPWTYGVLLSVGAFTLVRFLLKTFLVLTQTLVLPGKSLKKFGATKGAWAVVTGASDGIGKEFALQLAAAGFNILLVARKEAMLSAVATEIANKTAGKVETRIQLIDFAKNDPAALSALKTVLGSLDIGVLVNNVGKSHDMPVYFAETSEQENDDIVMININGTLRVTRAVLPGMIQRKRGLILNIGSFAGQIPSPMLATYSGSKVFVSTFTSALAEEVKAHGITVQHLNTYFVVSKMSNIRRSSMMVPTPAAYVRSALSKVGLSCGAVMTDRPGTLTPFWSHALVDYLVHVVGWKAGFISYTHTLHKDIRRRALRKLEREAKKQ
ncbi:NAD(P)-binding protein [Paxillus ammoniavirescens]|nr:NAD(P)-binding protein [Paxillus ammoniavirescens]